MREAPSIRTGDLVQMRKPHACGANEWAVISTGVDIRARCLRCGRAVLMPRPDFLRALRRLTRPDRAEGSEQSASAPD